MTKKRVPIGDNDLQDVSITIAGAANRMWLVSVKGHPDENLARAPVSCTAPYAIERGGLMEALRYFTSRAAPLPATKKKR